MKYCPTCRRHVNGALSCAGCGVASGTLPDAAPEPAPAMTARLPPPRATAHPVRAGTRRPPGLPGPAGTPASPGRRSTRGPGLLPALLATCIGAVVLLVTTGAGAGSAPPRSAVLSAPIGGDAGRPRPAAPRAQQPQQALVAEPLTDAGVTAGPDTATAYPGPLTRPSGSAEPAGAPAPGDPAQPAGPPPRPGAAAAEPPRAPAEGAKRPEPTPPPSAPPSRPPAPAPVETSAPSPNPTLRTSPSPAASPDCLIQLLFVCLS
ncbi:hypothetical protein GCM10010495_77770 [Kitasatospora herbaricolor]|uniref:hypothetical protein n=1 Tax=Kitasatospora herbaricolor TaxID=68217 RepID=UPI00174C3837|nr:hypothetical protein [Kitasatospora herbaricolor]MDQ0312908.1 hypothetical protein [Kitasatospora herbaricolor]GGV48449.1 hypothetical protein GCM10010495_77770 [Kitasatospora herbaricolor]